MVTTPNGPIKTKHRVMESCLRPIGAQDYRVPHFLILTRDTVTKMSHTVIILEQIVE